MTYWIIDSMLAFLISVLLAGILIPQILLIAFRKNLMDEPNERKIHTSAVPRLGGIAFKPVIFFSIAILCGVNIAIGHSEIAVAIGENSRGLCFAFCAVMVVYLVGMADDLIGIRYRAKFVVQCLCACLLIAGGYWFNNLYGLFGIYELSPWVGYPMTVLVVVFVINAINLIDGLCSGLCSIAFFFYGVIFLQHGNWIYALMAFSTLGVLVPFFYYNVFGNPVKRQKIFMGDTGSLTVGLLICFLGMELVISDTYESNPLVLAFAPLMIPCCDVVRVYLHRVRFHQNPFMPDRNHIHHKLLALGMRQRTAMIVIVSSSLVFSLVNIVLSRFVDINWLLLADAAFWTVSNMWLTRRIMIGEGLREPDRRGAP